jgi:hypothetical protein
MVDGGTSVMMVMKISSKSPSRQGARMEFLVPNRGFWWWRRSGSLSGKNTGDSRWWASLRSVVSLLIEFGSTYNSAQAASRKDVERAFGILQSQFAIVRGPARFWDQECLWYIMTVCVIMHNIIIEDDRGKNIDHTHYELMGVPMQVRRSAHRIPRFITSYHAIRSRTHMMSSKKISWKNGGIGMDNNSCILFKNYMVYFFKTMLYCCILIRKLVIFVVNNFMYLLYLSWTICCICMVHLFVNLWSLFDLLWCIVGCDCCFHRRCALYNGASDEGPLLALVKPL